MKPEKQKRAGLYVRVSTNEQSVALQEAELKEYAEKRGWLVHHVYADKGISGAKTQRPALDRLFADCRKRAIDVVLIWKFDRFSRSLVHLVRALEEFRSLGIDFVSCTEAVDSSGPAGELIFQIFGAIAQFERSLIAERVKAGLVQARRQGKRLGRKPLREFTRDDIDRLLAAYDGQRSSCRKLARDFHTTEFMVKKLVKARA